MKKGKFEIVYEEKLVEVDAMEFAIFGYGSFIVHRDVTYPTLWTVSEPRTGYYVRGNFTTRKAAIAEVTAEVCKLTPEFLHERTARYLKDDFPTTRYEKEEYGQDS